MVYSSSLIPGKFCEVKYDGTTAGMTREELARIFNDSYNRVIRGPAGTSGDFLAALYDLLVASSDEAASKFKGTDMAAQLRMLQASITVLMVFFATGRVNESLLRIAERHSKRSADISARLYEEWMDCLIETVRRFDPHFDLEVEAAWRAVFAKGIEFMTSKYE